MVDDESSDRGIRLAYCSNVHPAETLAGIEDELTRHAAKVRGRAARRSTLGVGLWLPRSVSDELLEGDGAAIPRFRDFLADKKLSVFTLNAFPYGGFHEARVKEKVFEPSWADSSRLEYTRQTARILAELLPDGEHGSISTCPIGLPSVGFDRVAAIENLRACGRTLAETEARTGKRIVLGLEPEPAALLETVSDAIAFLDHEVFRDAEDTLRRYLGVCFDACHESVMHQDAEESLRNLRDAGIVLAKLQLSSALEVPHPLDNVEGMARLKTFDEGRYFHQVAYRRKDGSFAIHRDLEEFFALPERNEELDGVEFVRVHFHVPIFAKLDGALRTTRNELQACAKEAQALALTDQFEVETYTFDVIPDSERDALGARSLSDCIALELKTAKSWLH